MDRYLSYRWRERLAVVYTINCLALGRLFFFYSNFSKFWLILKAQSMLWAWSISWKARNSHCCSKSDIAPLQSRSGRRCGARANPTLLKECGSKYLGWVGRAFRVLVKAVSCLFSPARHLWRYKFLVRAKNMAKGNFGLFIMKSCPLEFDAWGGRVPLHRLKVMPVTCRLSWDPCFEVKAPFQTFLSDISLLPLLKLIEKCLNFRCWWTLLLIAHLRNF